MYFLEKFLIFLYFSLALSKSESIVKTLVSSVETYFNFREIHMLTFFSCLNLHENVEIYKTLNEKHFSIQIITQKTEWIYPDRTQVGVIADMDCDVTHFYLKNSTENMYFMNKFIWMFYDISGLKTVEEIGIFFNELDVLPVSEVIVAQYSNRDSLSARNTSWIYFDIWRMSMKHNPIVNRINANISSNDELIQNLAKFGTVGSRRTDLGGMIMDAGVVVSKLNVFYFIEVKIVFKQIYYFILRLHFLIFLHHLMICLCEILIYLLVLIIHMFNICCKTLISVSIYDKLMIMVGEQGGLLNLMD